jgi:hypothetical protein
MDTADSQPSAPRDAGLPVREAAARTGGLVVVAAIMAPASLAMTVLVTLDSDPTALVFLLFDVASCCAGAVMVQGGVCPFLGFLFPSFLIAFQVGVYLDDARFYFASFFLLWLGGICARSLVVFFILCWHWNFAGDPSPQSRIADIGEEPASPPSIECDASEAEKREMRGRLEVSASLP